MVFRNFYIQLIIRILLIILTCLLLTWLVMSGKNWLFSLHAAALLLAEGWLLVRYLNRWNIELSGYFERLQAGDPTIGTATLESFPKLKEMSSSLKKLKKSIGDERKKLLDVFNRCVALAFFPADAANLPYG